MTISFTKKVDPINFLNLSGFEFERLVFATLLRMYAWDRLDWFGQSGGDYGRDIVGVRDNKYGYKETVVIACANWKTFVSTKGTSDIDKIIAGMPDVPDEIVIVTGEDVSAAVKDKCSKYGTKQGVNVVQIWSGPEFEEHLRFHASAVLSRFVNGEELPDESKDLREFVSQLDPITEREAGELVARIFKRPAFSTSIGYESSLPAFRQAIGDTINALNNGLWRDREGTLIARIPSRYDFPNQIVQNALEKAVDGLIELRQTFDEGLRAKTIRPCDDPESPIFIIEYDCRDLLNLVRDRVIRFVNEALHELGVCSV